METQDQVGKRVKKARMRGEERKAFILAQAKGVFASHSYAEASTGELARASGITEPILYKHFRNKKGLFLAVLAEFGNLFMQRLEQRVAQRMQHTVMDALEHIILDYLATIKADPDIHKVFFQALAESDDAQIMAGVAQHNQRVYQLIYTLLQQAQEQKWLRQDVDVTAAAWGYFSMIINMQYSVMLQTRETPDEGMLQEISRLWLYALRAENV